MKYARKAEVREGSVLVTDGGFTCMGEGQQKTVEKAPDGLFVPCGDGRHYIDGQLEGGHYVGLQLA